MLHDSLPGGSELFFPVSFFYFFRYFAIISAESSGLVARVVDNLHTSKLCGSREFDSCQKKIFILASVAENVST